MKRGSLNISIEAIVIVVLAMTLLGLGLGFVRSQFSQITSVSSEVQEQVREQITAQLRTSGEKISFPRSVIMSRNEQKVLTVGVQNTGISRIYFGFNLSLEKGNSDHEVSEYDLRYISNPCSNFLDPSESDAFGVNVKAPNTAGVDTMIVQVMVASTDEEGNCVSDPESTQRYAAKTAFVTVG